MRAMSPQSSLASARFEPLLNPNSRVFHLFVSDKLEQLRVKLGVCYKFGGVEQGLSSYLSSVALLDFR